MTDEEAIKRLRLRRVQWFLADQGPPLPTGCQAYWRVTPDSPQGWQANMLGGIQAPPDQLGTVLDRAIAFFSAAGADTWVSLSEFSPLWAARDLLISRGFVLGDDWDAMLCRQVQPPPPTLAMLRLATSAADLRWAAWIAEQVETNLPLALDDPVVEQRWERYRYEYSSWHTRFLLARLQRQPVATARLTAEPLPIIVGVATLPAARGRGIASAVTAHLTTEALRTKSACALYAERGSQAARIYTQIGYAPLFRLQAWVRRIER